MKLSGIAATSNVIESFFGVLDLVINEQSKNLSYHVPSGLATWRYNKTADWFLGLRETQRNQLAKEARREGKADKAVTDSIIDGAAEHSVDRFEATKIKQRNKMKTKAKALLLHKKINVFKTKTEWRHFLEGKDKMSNAVRAVIALQVRLLVQRYGLKRVDFMAFSAKGQGVQPVFPNDVVLEQYEVNVLGKIHSGAIKLPEPQSIACALTRSKASRFSRRDETYKGQRHDLRGWCNR